MEIINPGSASTPAPVVGPARVRVPAEQLGHEGGVAVVAGVHQRRPARVVTAVQGQGGVLGDTSMKLFANIIRSSQPPVRTSEG